MASMKGHPGNMTRRLLWVAGALVCLILAGVLLYGQVCAFMNFKFGGDYPVYVGTLWNIAHGRSFVYSLDAPYLALHLSFSLALLSPLFLLFDHPFLLSFVQWALLVAGGGILWRCAVRVRMPGHLTLALLVFWLAHPFVQSVLLCEFHGVSMYFLTAPMLYYFLLFRRNWAWVPLVLILGLREEAGLMVVPLLLYFAVSERWRAGYVYAGVAVAYVLLACFVLYPAINDMTLLARRAGYVPMPGRPEDAGADPLWLQRGRSFLMILLVVLPFLRYGWKPLLVIPSLAILLTLGGTYHRQASLIIHYPAVIVSTLAVALLESWRKGAARSENQRRRWAVVCSVYLVVWTAWCYYAHGFLWGSRAPAKFVRLYQTINTHGLHALWVARNHVPRDGVLYADQRLGGFVANRAQYTFDESVLDDPDYADISVFCYQYGMPKTCMEGLASNTWGVIYLDDFYAVLQRHADPSRNAEAIRDLHTPMVRCSDSSMRAGENRFIPGRGTVRYWRGKATKWPAMVSYGRASELPPGNYLARFVLKSEDADKEGGSEPRDTGMLALHIRDTERRLAEAPAAVDESGEWREQKISFSLDAATEVEPRVLGGGRRLWLKHVVFESIDESMQSERADSHKTGGE